MSNVLILTNNKDSHAKVVAKSLIKKGAVAIEWYPEEFLLNQKINHNFPSCKEHYITLSGKHKINLLDIDVVWDRHSRFPIIPQTIDPVDEKFIAQENRLHMKSLWYDLEETAKWINPFSSFDKSNSKMSQLREASHLGLSIPETLISNDKHKITEFIESNYPIITIYKTFSPAHWHKNNVNYGCYTSVITPEMLTSEESISLTPGIFQKIVEKSYEIRVTFFDNEYIAVKIHNSEVLDWRILNNTPKLKLSPIRIPSEIEIKCLNLMRNLGIVFGCFDFIVTPLQEYIFLEVNPMGQFLWIEEILPELKLLDKFCEFILSKGNKEHTNLFESQKVCLNEMAES